MDELLLVGLDCQSVIHNSCRWTLLRLSSAANAEVGNKISKLQQLE